MSGHFCEWLGFNFAIIGHLYARSTKVIDWSPDWYTQLSDYVGGSEGKGQSREKIHGEKGKTRKYHPPSSSEGTLKRNLNKINLQSFEERGFFNWVAWLHKGQVLSY